MTDRLHERLPLSLRVEYRTAGAFLVAYSVNLSTGGMFLESARPHPIGTRLTLTLAVPGADPVELAGEVVWVREVPAEGKPAGMGVRFVEPVDSRYGEMIDRLASGFRGLRVVVLAPSAQARALLARGVRSLMASAGIVEAPDSVGAEVAFSDDADLAVVDLDDAEAEGLVALRLAKIGRRPIPVIVLASQEGDRIRAGSLDADEVLPNPPALTELQAAIVRALGKPARVS